GIADRTPNCLVSYDAEQTTPRLSAEPPTMSSGARPAPSGSTNRATATKNASASASRTLGTTFTAGAHDGNHGRVQGERTQRHGTPGHAAGRKRERSHRGPGILGPGGPHQSSRGAVRQGRVRRAVARSLPR